MTNENQINTRDSIATKLLRIVFAFYIVIALVITTSHMIMEYGYQKNNINRDLKDIQKTFEQVLAINMWNLNQESLQSTIEGMLKIPVIVGVKIQNEDCLNIAVGGIISQGEKIGNVGLHVSQLGLTAQESIVHKNEKYKHAIFKHEFPIIYNNINVNKKLGYATIYSNSSVIYRRVKLGFLMLIINTILKIVALWYIFLFFSTRLLRNPLISLSLATRNIRLDNLDTFRIKIQTSGRNELKILEESFNSMIINLHESIIERKEIENNLRLSKEKYRELYEYNPTMYFTLNNEGTVLSVNDYGAQQLGYSVDELIGYSVLKVFHPDDIEKVKERFKHCLETPNKVINWVFRKIRKNGSMLWVEEYVRSIEQADGSLIVFVVCSDISIRKEQEEEVHHLRNYLTNIIDSMPSMLIGIDAEFKITQWNKTAEQSSGIEASKAHGKKLFDLIPDMVSEMDKITESIKTRETKRDRKRASQRIDGTYYEDITIYPLIANGVEGAVIRIDDVTDKVRLEEMMVQSEKMMSVGGLAAGMAHEINNPLAGIIQNVQVMENRLTGNFPMNKKIAEKYGINFESLSKYIAERDITGMLKDIKDAGLRASTIVKNMLGFSRKSDESFSLYGLPDLFDKTLKLASTDYDLRKKYDFKVIKITKQIKENIPNVQCEAAKIQQVLLNILRNGAQAMFEAETEKPEFIFKLSHDEMKNIVILEIEDNGPGMDEDIRKRIFEPFFTTKAVGEGTGLGLSVSYFIITENHGGEMYCESEKGKGTRFVIKLPVSKEIIYER